MGQHWKAGEKLRKFRVDGFLLFCEARSKISCKYEGWLTSCLVLWLLRVPAEHTQVPSPKTFAQGNLALWIQGTCAHFDSCFYGENTFSAQNKIKPLSRKWSGPQREAPQCPMAFVQILGSETRFCLRWSQGPCPRSAVGFTVTFWTSFSLSWCRLFRPPWDNLGCSWGY